MSDIPKTYTPSEVEPKLYRFWEENDLFAADPNSGKPPYCIMMPPPNVTGELHMGHALQDSLQDMLIRLKRMQGYESHWQAGTDHAGIATQNVVEKALAKEGVTRHELGREKFIEKVWEWKKKYGNRILQQKRLLGDSPDWSRERFTFDEGLSKAVSTVFVHLYDKGLIYRGNYIVNWCPRCHTAISDEEVNHQDEATHLWHFKYPISGLTTKTQRHEEEGASSLRDFVVNPEYVVVATTRPETMLGDTAIAINPNDERLTHLHGGKVLLPLMNREIPVILDEYVDPAFGTGQVKVTPAHDPNDFEMGKRHNLPSIVVMDEKGVMNHSAGQFKGLDRFKAREAIVKAMEEAGLLEKIEDYTTSIGHCSRCKTVIEPYLSLQWFVKMKPLAEPALEAVRNGSIKFYPGRWEKTYYAWMENIRDWCISRQLWWGHRIPVWYCKACGEIIVRTDEPDSCPKCHSTSLRQDEDVLDTWFSSWLWPFSTLGWPEKTPELDFWYPTKVLVSGYDIIFFWIARMIMAGIEFMGKAPYEAIFITGMIKDEQGRWMSKSLGNGIDPALMVEQYGADAVRYTLITLATEGQDIKLSPSRFEGGRNFANKLWNAYRFLMGNAERLTTKTRSHEEETGETLCLRDLVVNAPLADRWIVSRLHATIEQVNASADKYRLYECLSTLYDFLWKEYCDWYLELLKGRLGPDMPEEEKRQALTTAISVFEAAMKLLHPGMPFITEEIYQGMLEFRIADFGMRNPTIRTPQSVICNPPSIMVSDYPKAEDFPADAGADAEMELLQKVISPIRTIRSEMRVPLERQAAAVIAGLTDPKRLEVLQANISDIKRLAVLSSFTFSDVRPAHSVAVVVDDFEIYVPLEGLIDLVVERGRLDKEIARLEGVIRGAEAKLGSAAFTEKAPANVVEYERQKLVECKAQLEAVKKNRGALE